ncbi:hypothetical protein F4604DRAFT_1677647 [Suillus subluteus]|nr:hypothetical protein F4604DRAFT_1677647 [Suillus subluteus]
MTTTTTTNSPLSQLWLAQIPSQHHANPWTHLSIHHPPPKHRIRRLCDFIADPHTIPAACPSKALEAWAVAVSTECAFQAPHATTTIYFSVIWSGYVFVERWWLGAVGAEVWVSATDCAVYDGASVVVVTVVCAVVPTFVVISIVVTVRSTHEFTEGGYERTLLSHKLYDKHPDNSRELGQVRLGIETSDQASRTCETRRVMIK